MSRRVLTGTLTALLLLTACGGGQGTDDGVTFTSPLYRYSISHPNRWDAVEASRMLIDREEPSTSSGATDILGRNASTRVTTMQLPAVIIAAEPASSDERIEDWISSIVDTVATMKGCSRPTDRDDIKIGGEPGTLLTYPDCPPDLGYLHLWAGVVHDGLAYHIVWFNDPGHEDADRAEFERMLSSMSFDE